MNKDTRPVLVTSLLLFNPLVPNAPFLYPLKTSENRKFFWCFQGVDEGCIGNEGLNEQY